MSSIYKNMSELLEERELNGWKLQKFEINPRRFNKCWAEYQAKTGRRLA